MTEKLKVCVCRKIRFDGKVESLKKKSESKQDHRWKEYTIAAIRSNLHLEINGELYDILCLESNEL